MDERHVGGGAAHVVGDGVAHARLRQRRRRRHHARGRARHDGLGRLARHDAGRHGAAVAVHDQQVALEALPLQLALQAPHVAVEDRLHGRVHRRRGAALVLAELRQQRVPERDVVVGPELARDLAGAQLVGRVGVGVQEMDDQALAAHGQQGAHGIRQLVLGERRDDLARHVHALVDLDAALARDQRLEAAGHAVGVGPRAAAELERVAEAARGDEPHLGHLALEHGVGGGGGAVDDEVEIARAHARLRDRRQHAVGLVGDGGRDLGQMHAAALRPRLVQQQVRERPAHVDASHPPHARPRSSAVRHHVISIRTIAALSRPRPSSRNSCSEYPGPRAIPLSAIRSPWISARGLTPSRHFAARAGFHASAAASVARRSILLNIARRRCALRPSGLLPADKIRLGGDGSTWHHR